MDLFFESLDRSRSRSAEVIPQRCFKPAIMLLSQDQNCQCSEGIFILLVTTTLIGSWDRLYQAWSNNGSSFSLQY